MRNLVFFAALFIAVSTTPAMTQSPPGSQSSAQSVQVATAPASVSSIYKQPIYTPSDERIGDVQDILLSPDGQATAVIVDIRTFLGAAEETNVALPYKAVLMTTRGDRLRMVTETTRENLRAATTFRYDRDKMAWVANDPK